MLALGCGRPTYTASGDVTAVDPAALQVTISHEDIPGLMRAMTMPFRVRSAEVLSGIAPGTRVRFELVQAGQAPIGTPLGPTGTPAAGPPGLPHPTPPPGRAGAPGGPGPLQTPA